MLFYILFVPCALCEFLETSPNVFQHVNGQYRIIITQDGIFAMQTKPIDPKDFKISDITKDKVISSCFLRFNPETNKHEELIVNGTLYLIDGTLNLKLGDLSINTDELNTYISFVVYDKNIDDSNQGILGIIGRSVVTNTTGSAFVALLEANMLSSKDGNVFEYIIRNSDLYKDGVKIQEGSKIGQKQDRSNFQDSCIGDNAVILSSQDLEEVKKFGKLKKNDEITKIFDSRKSHDIAKDFLIIRVEDSSVIFLDYINANIKIAKKLGKTSISDKTLCVIKNIDID